MKKDKKTLYKVIIIILLIPNIIMIYDQIYIYNRINSNKSVIKTSDKNDNDEIISMMLETDYNSGEYVASTSNSFPSNGYSFNTEKSGCMYGSKISYNYLDNTLIFTGDKTDECFAYFDQVNFIDSISISDISATGATLTITSVSSKTNISKYYYSIDNGNTWIESSSNVISISDLSMGTIYLVKVYLLDSEGVKSEYNEVSFETLTLLTFTIEGTAYYADPGMTWKEWVASDYNIDSVYKGDVCNGTYITGPYTNGEYYAIYYEEDYILAISNVEEKNYSLKNISWPKGTNCAPARR